MEHGERRSQALDPVRSFRAACALIAIHVVVAEALTLEPGTAVSDRWEAVLVPLVLLAAASVVYPGVRPGTAAVIALSLAVLSIAGGVLAIVAAGAEGVDASSATGLALLGAGALLGWLGSAGLWNSRKEGRHRVARRLMLGLVAALFAFEVLLPVGFALVATHRPVFAPERDPIDRSHREVTIRTVDALELGASYVPSRNGAAVIVFPERSEASPYVDMLAENGYGVLALDMRGYGSSEGNPNAYGWGATADINAAVGFLRGQAEGQRRPGRGAWTLRRRRADDRGRGPQSGVAGSGVRGRG